MIILIAESKTMKGGGMIVSPGLYKDHVPVGEAYAADIMQRIAGMSVGEIAETVKISDKMAAGLREMAYDFPNKNYGLCAMEAFTGVVFRNLDYESLSPDAKKKADTNVRIISSLYGWLRPTDIIKPYRLEYSSPVAPDGTSLSTFWKGKVTVQLVRTLQDAGETEILDLLPADAAKCVDWKLVKRFAKVWKVDFKEQHGSDMKTPHAGRLKALRGELLRCILQYGLSNAKDISQFENDTMMPLENYQYRDRLAFITAP